MATKPFICDECGTRNTPDSKYCKECGAQIHDAYQTIPLTEYDRIDDPSEQERLTQFLDMAFWHTEAGNNEAAVRACKAALALNANSTTALSLLGSLYEKQGDDAEAIKLFERVLALNPDSMADRVKLDQLYDGIHAQPVRSSPVYRWLPPAFGTARFSEMAIVLRERIKGMRPQGGRPFSPKTTPALLAGVGLLIVIAGALFLVRPSSTRGAVTVTPIVQNAPAQRVAQRPQYSPSQSPGIPPPLVLTPATPPLQTDSRPSFVASLPNDPFAGGVGTPMPHEEYDQQLSAGTQPAPRRTVDAYGRLHALPPLTAVPNADGGPLPPAPVSVPQDVGADAPISPNSDLARHTVVVRHLTGLQEFAPQDPAAQSSGTGGPPQESPATNISAEPPSHIQITVDPATPSSGAGASSGTLSSTGSGGNGSAQAGEDLQQSAFALQQQAKYGQAAAEYQKAIAAYQAQVASGTDRDAATRGLQACQTGLQICRQSH